MIEVKGDLFAPPVPVAAICITTNGETDRRGLAIMGRGVALEARKRWPLIAGILGARLREYGNTPALLTNGGFPIQLDGTTVRMPFHIITLPTKHRWCEASSLTLIRRSLEAVRAITEANYFAKVAFPRLGCQNGRLDWAEVQPHVAELLPGPRWLVLHPEGP